MTASRKPPLDDRAIELVQSACERLERLIADIDGNAARRGALREGMMGVVRDLRGLAYPTLATGSGGVVSALEAPSTTTTRRSPIAVPAEQRALDFNSSPAPTAAPPPPAIAPRPNVAATLSDEQRVGVSLAENHDIAVGEARAGTGKSTLLVGVSERLPGRGLYIAYNHDIARESESRFPRKVLVRTGHALAYAAVAREYADAGKPIRDWNIPEVRQHLSLDESELHLAYAARETLARFLTSTAAEVDHQHIDPSTASKLLRRARVGAASLDEARERVEAESKRVIELAQKLWRASKEISTGAPLPHDGYLRIWWERKPRLDVDFILGDEWQDAVPILNDLLLQQQCRRVFVGDPWQQLYAWRGATNAMAHLPGKRFTLTQSYRFGAPIASAANAIISLRGERALVVGNPARASRVGDIDPAQSFTVLCRTNAGLCLRAAKFAPTHKTAVVGGTREIVELMKSAYALFTQRPKSEVRHPLLRDFSSYRALKDYTERSNDRECSLVVRLLDEYGSALAGIIHTLETGLVAPAEAHVVLSTVHKAKGLEFAQVVLDEDFIDVYDHNGDLRGEEANILYVAATRARTVLQPNSTLLSIMGAGAPRPAYPRAADATRDHRRAPAAFKVRPG